MWHFIAPFHGEGCAILMRCWANLCHRIREQWPEESIEMWTIMRKTQESAAKISRNSPLLWNEYKSKQFINNYCFRLLVCLKSRNAPLRHERQNGFYSRRLTSKLNQIYDEKVGGEWAQSPPIWSREVRGWPSFIKKTKLTGVIYCSFAGVFTNNLDIRQ